MNLRIQKLVNLTGKLTKTLLQFWIRHIVIVVLVSILSSLVVYFFGVSIEQIPRQTIPFLATVLSTLLGLTFTAFAVISAFMPNLRRDYVETTTFLNVGRTFIFTLLIQFVSLLLSFFAYLSYESTYASDVLKITVVGTMFSFGFLGMLIWEMFRIFRIVRKGIIRDSN